MPPPAEKSAKDQLFYLPQKNVNDPRVRIDLTSGSYSLSASQLTDYEALARRAAGTLNSPTILAEYPLGQVPDNSTGDWSNHTINAPIDEYQKADLLNAPFKVPPFRPMGENWLERRKKHGKGRELHHVPSTSYSTQPYVGRGWSYRNGPSSQKGGGQDKSACSPATVTRPSKDNLVLTVAVHQPNTRWKSPPNHLTLGAPARGRVPVGF